MPFLRKKIIILAAVAVLIAILLIALRFGQTLWLPAKPSVSNAQLITPTPDMNIIGNTQVIARAQSKSPIEALEAVAIVGGKEPQLLLIQREDENFIKIAGLWQAANYPIGRYNLDVLIYSKYDYPPTPLVTLTVPVNILNP